MRVSDLDKGDVIKLENKIFEVIEIKHLHLGRGSANLNLTLKNLQTGQRIEKVFKPDEKVDYLDIERRKIVFEKEDQNFYYFKNKESLSKLDKKLFIYLKNYLKNGLEVIGYFDENDNLITVELPKIIELKVIETPPDFKGGTVQSNYKTALLETGLEIKVPFFIKEGDIIRINTETGEYVERVQK